MTLLIVSCRQGGRGAAGAAGRIWKCQGLSELENDARLGSRVPELGAGAIEAQGPCFSSWFCVLPARPSHLPHSSHQDPVSSQVFISSLGDHQRLISVLGPSSTFLGDGI